MATERTQSGISQSRSVDDRELRALLERLHRMDMVGLQPPTPSVDDIAEAMEMPAEEVYDELLLLREGLRRAHVVTEMGRLEEPLHRVERASPASSYDGPGARLRNETIDGILDEVRKTNIRAQRRRAQELLKKGNRQPWDGWRIIQSTIVLLLLLAASIAIVMATGNLVK